ncbi:MAG: biopolymer transporter ExbD [Planctomycetes bacterium]|nr:biopolymer transporter ExbD [Planctomycetota bacterium]
MSKLKVELIEPATFDMTPMIDCVFQLIIFFMLATDMSQRELEALIPPKAPKAQPIAPNEDDRLIINIVHEDLKKITCAGWKELETIKNEKEMLKNPYKCANVSHWVIKVKGKSYKSIQELTSLLTSEADNYYREPEDANGLRPSKKVVMLRCDFRAPFQATESVMRACVDKNVAIYKLEFCALEK